MSLAELLDALDYNQYPQYYLKTEAQQAPDIAPLFRTARDIGIDGIYVFRSSSQETNTLPVRPAVYVAEAKTTDEARDIHRYLWNVGHAPFLIIKLPDHVSVYTGFDYSESEDTGVLEPNIALEKQSMREALADFSAYSINTGLLWEKRGNDLNPDRRVDKRLLRNLNTLSNILITNEKLESELAHALIGKYIYIRYLHDRKLLSDEWLKRNNIDINLVFGRDATVEGLQQLIKALEGWLNGNIFPLDFTALTDRHVAQVAAVFKGDQPLTANLSQLSLDLKVYDFEYIPIETLSSIYEQFLHEQGKGRGIGAYYTPEYLADYLLAEMNAVRPLKKGMRILDPSCGSGIFLVFVYRRLIELELVKTSDGKISLRELGELLEYLYGIERMVDACFIAEFSLILTLLHYADPTELLAENSQFKFPSLHNTHIFHYDFFDSACPLWREQTKFDWIVGNPPWIKANPDKEEFAYAWITENQEERPTSNYSVSEAFSWRVIDLLLSNGCVGLILPAKSLYNHHSEKYRQQFFSKHEIVRMTNFSNLRRELFEGRATAPAVTMIYRRASYEREKPLIDHYGPFLINQASNIDGRLLTIAMNNSEYQAVSPYEAESGEAATWKFALWGTYRDRRAIARLRRLFPMTLGQFYKDNEKNGWHLHEGSQLRDSSRQAQEDIEYLPYLVGKNRLNTTNLDKSERLFSIPESAFEKLLPEECNIRVQGGSKGLRTSDPPHIILNASWKYVIYSDQFFVIPPRQIGLAAPKGHEDYLRALSLYLSSSLVRYYLFFQTPSFGIERDRITLRDVKSIPIPELTSEQIQVLVALHKDLVHREISGDTLYLRNDLDEQVVRLLKVPSNISTLANEFNRIRMNLIENSRLNEAVKYPGRENLVAYAEQLQLELDSFATKSSKHHQVTIHQSPEAIACTVELKSSEGRLPVIVEDRVSGDAEVFGRLRNELNKNFSQWVYVEKELRVFEGSAVHIYKKPLLINWTKTQALNDADEIIAESLYAARDNLNELSRP